MWYFLSIFTIMLASLILSLVASVIFHYHYSSAVSSSPKAQEGSRQRIMGKITEGIRQRQDEESEARE
jgi:hypothetical protein